MSPIDVLNTIRWAGGQVIVEDGGLQISCPPGTLTPEAVACLREHKTDLIRLLTPVDEERSSLQWLEQLPPAKVDTVFSKACREWDEFVGLIDTAPDPDEDPWPADDGDEPDPCPQCGSLAAWESMTGRWRCLWCDPPKKAIMALERAEQIRRRCGLESPPGTKKLLKSLSALANKQAL